MASVPMTGTYVFEDINFKLTIKGAWPENGLIAGSYATQYSPEGEFSVDSDTIAHYSWVHSEKQGRDGVAPFNINITASIRPEKKALLHL